MTALPTRSVDPSERVKELAPDVVLTDAVTLTYSWTGGYEKLDIEFEGGGSSHYAGSFHPDGYCEGRGICCYCGRTLFDD